MSTLVSEQKKPVIISPTMVVVFIVVLKGHYHKLDAYLREELASFSNVHLTPLATGRHNSKGYNRIKVALQSVKEGARPEEYQGYQLRYPIELVGEIKRILEGFFSAL
ncbi:MAG: hypothetical protein R3B55_00745 [Candidatus Paceibacterota bacterium]